MAIRSLKIAAIIAAAPAVLWGCEASPIRFDDLRPGETRPAHTLITGDFDALCVLGPYQDRLDDTVPFRERVNAHLSEIDYRGTESDWSVVLVRASEVEVLRFRRSARLDILPASIRDKADTFDIPRNFEPATCADGPVAAFAKLQRDNRIYIMLGKNTD